MRTADQQGQCPSFLGGFDENVIYFSLLHFSLLLLCVFLLYFKFHLKFILHVPQDLTWVVIPEDGSGKEKVTGGEGEPWTPG